MNCEEAKTIGQAILDRLKDTFYDYRIWSDGGWLRHAPEYLLTVRSAEAIGNKGWFVTLEEPVKSILEYANAQTRGHTPRSTTTLSKECVDIVVWDKKDPWLLVEVKNSGKINKNKTRKKHLIWNDARRIKSLLNRGGSLQSGYGLMIVYLQSEDQISVKQAITEIQEYCIDCNMELLNQEIVEEAKTSKWRTDKDKCWAIACYLIRPPK